MKNIFFSIALSSAVLLTQCQSAAAPATHTQELLNAFWQAQTAQQITQTAQALSAEVSDVDSLYRWLKAGPTYASTVPTGQLELSRTDAEGIEYPYVLLVPEDYTPTRAYSVEFNLHGGVNRAKVKAGESAWRQGYDSLKMPDRIVVVPVAWKDAYWWFDNQADNLPAILHQVKQRYHVDDNRVYLTGVSDGGTGSYFFAFMQPTEWAAFLPFIGSPGVLKNPLGRVSHPLSFENLRGKPLFIVNGENDRLYPAHRIKPYINQMEEAKADYEYTVIAGGEHNTAWLPEQRTRIEAFKREHVRDPLPENLRWVASRTDRYNRHYWIRIDGLHSEEEAGRLIVERKGNEIDVNALHVTNFTLLLNPEEVDFGQPITVRVNGQNVYSGMVTQSVETLLQWAARDRDRTLLFTAELSLQTFAP